MKKPCRERWIFADFRCAAGLTGKNEKNRKKLLTIRECFGKIYKRSSELTKKYRYAALAQLVERRLGKAEVGGSNPLGSFLNLLIISGDFFAVYKDVGGKRYFAPYDTGLFRTSYSHNPQKHS